MAARIAASSAADGGAYGPGPAAAKEERQSNAMPNWNAAMLMEIAPTNELVHNARGRMRREKTDALANEDHLSASGVYRLREEETLVTKLGHNGKRRFS